jgi:hypothetical protein
MMIASKTDCTISVPDGIELYMLTASYALPPNSEINPHFRFINPPVGYHLDPMCYLLERDGGGIVPDCMVKTNLPIRRPKPNTQSDEQVVEVSELSDDPLKGVECYRFAPGSRLPVGSKISKAVTVYT